MRRKKHRLTKACRQISAAIVQLGMIADSIVDKLEELPAPVFINLDRRRKVELTKIISVEITTKQEEIEDMYPDYTSDLPEVILVVTTCKDDYVLEPDEIEPFLLENRCFFGDLMIEYQDIIINKQETDELPY
jgi:hypothetical protein